MNSSEKNVFVTLFNSLYLSRGLSLYHSLRRHSKSFVLYIIAFDELVEKKLMELKLEDVEVIPLKDIEDEKLLKAKKNRNATEYCWTCSSKSILHVLEKYKVGKCTYLDADIYFFSDPQVLIDELRNDDVIITEHRFSSYCDQTTKSGKYCVQFVTVKNTENGRNIVNWWYERCLEWCYSRYEDGKLGDQMYLDYFHELFDGVHDLEHLGGGIAPWNVSQYSFFREGNSVLFNHKDRNVRNGMTVFFHFHGLEFFDKDVVHLSPNGYLIPGTAISHIYKEYISINYEVSNRYGLDSMNNNCRNEKHYRDDNIDYLKHINNYYNRSLFF